MKRQNARADGIGVPHVVETDPYRFYSFSAAPDFVREEAAYPARGMKKRGFAHDAA